MYLQPIPRHYVVEDGHKFLLQNDDKIVLCHQCNDKDIESAKLLKMAIKELIRLDLKLNKAYLNNACKEAIFLIKEEGIEEEGYRLTINESKVEIKATTSTGLFYGVQTFIQIIKNEGMELSPVNIEDYPYFKHRGYYHDVTRGKVPTLKTLKQLVDKLAHYKINQLQLYIEHSFAYKGFSEVWVDKDPLTSEEILLLDEYCQKRHIELVPSIAVFGHLYEVLRSESYKELCELEDESDFSFYDRMAHHTLDVSNEKSLVLVEKMIHEFLPLFSSNKFNIGCDETFDLGKGKSSLLLNQLSEGQLYVSFLNKIISIAKQHHKEVLFWGDVILRYEHLLDQIDHDVTCLNWNYYYLVEENETKLIGESGIAQYVCPGVAGWNHFMNLMNKGFENIRRMVSYAVKYSADGVLTTDWGDYGHINLLGNSIPLMIYGAASSWNPLASMTKEASFQAISFLEYRDSSLRIVQLLADLSECQKMTWYEIVKWKEKFQTDMKEVLIEEYQRFNPADIQADYYRATALERELRQYLPFIQKENEVDFKEFLISTEAIILFNDFYLHLLKNDFGKSQSHPVTSTKALAVNIEEWFYRYQFIWRERNKESELIRITEVIKYLCKYLRNL